MGQNVTLKQVNVPVNQGSPDIDVMNVCQNTLDSDEWDVSHVTVTQSDRSMDSVTIKLDNVNVNQVSLVTNVTNVTQITLASVKMDVVHVIVTWTDQNSLNAIMRAIVSAALVFKVKSVTNAKKTISISAPDAKNVTIVTIWLKWW